MLFLSPLRYPGGKRKITNFIKLLYQSNDLLDGEYVEPYAGGASVALALLYDEYVRHIHINDLDQGVYAFWHSALNETESLCRLINDTTVTMDTWHNQRQVQKDSSASLLELGFSTFFLNRTNRSGIISGGVIGGKEQKGQWKLDARYNKHELVHRIEKIGRFKARISLYNMDAVTLITDLIPHLSERLLIYFDPPYYVKGQQLLYTNYYNPEDHKVVAKLIHTLERKWVVSYDDVPEIRALYQEYRHLSYGLNYSAQDRYKGAEVMFFCKNLEIPEVNEPTKIKPRYLQYYLL